ncbi:hypothetical protein LCGC14_1527420 [marine sediment metagenome]|uniref:Uncharacterized protein n=1 Tax=marine sediment metagenome TaxID=412755 RepID=A0A0F9IX88_9ZZZZ
MIGKVYIIRENELDMVKFYILNSVMEGLKEDMIDFVMKTPITNKTINDLNVLEGSLRYYIENGYKKWLSET